MKVLLVTGGELPHSFERFIRVFRHKVGTCEHLHLNWNQSALELNTLFQQYRNSMAFDRLVACYQQSEGLSRLLPLFNGLEQQTLLSLHHEQSVERGIIAKYVRTNPWLRWTGSDQTSFDYYKRIGMDAYLISPLSASNNRVIQLEKLQNFYCHILSDNSNKTSLVLPPEPKYCHYRYASENISRYIESQVKQGDVVVISAQHFFERHIIALAVAQGAAVVVQTSEISIRTADNFMTRACVMIDSPAELSSLFEQIYLGESTELLSKIFSQSTYCSPEEVASQLNTIIGHEGRNREAYMNRSPWL